MFELSRTHLYCNFSHWTLGESATHHPLPVFLFRLFYCKIYETAEILRVRRSRAGSAKAFDLTLRSARCVDMALRSCIWAVKWSGTVSTQNKPWGQSATRGRNCSQIRFGVVMDLFSRTGLRRLSRPPGRQARLILCFTSTWTEFANLLCLALRPGYFVYYRLVVLRQLLFLSSFLVSPSLPLFLCASLFVTLWLLSLCLSLKVLFCLIFWLLYLLVFFLLRFFKSLCVSVSLYLVHEKRSKQVPEYPIPSHCTHQATRASKWGPGSNVDGVFLGIPRFQTGKEHFAKWLMNVKPLNVTIPSANERSWFVRVASKRKQEPPRQKRPWWRRKFSTEGQKCSTRGQFPALFSWFPLCPPTEMKFIKSAAVGAAYKFLHNFPSGSLGFLSRHKVVCEKRLSDRFWPRRLGSITL